MAGLDRGGACDGLAFRIPAAAVEAETEVLWRREMLAPAYTAVIAPVRTDGAEVAMLAFVADPGTEMIRTDLDRAAQVELLATGTGFLGSSLEYLDNLLAHLKALGIADPDLVALRDAARARASGATEACNPSAPRAFPVTGR